MRPHLPLLPLAAIALAAALGACTTTSTPETAMTAGGFAFQSHVRPLFEHRCIQCHNDKRPTAGLNLQDREGSLDPSKKFIIPGQPDESRIYRAVMLENAHPNVMPGDGWGISENRRAAIRAWIADGAPWPEGREGKLKKKSYRVEKEDYL